MRGVERVWALGPPALAAVRAPPVVELVALEGGGGKRLIRPNPIPGVLCVCMHAPQSTPLLLTCPQTQSRSFSFSFSLRRSRSRSLPRDRDRSRSLPLSLPLSRERLRR